tara:strand:+ start:20157 stop:20822 length:666 start_codon:yes stop_codon:yes gene_type:complete
MDKYDTSKALEAKKAKAELIKKHTPKLLTEQQTAHLESMKKIARTLTEANPDSYQLHPILPYIHDDYCGLHVPANLVILAKKDYKEGEVNDMQGGIYLENILKDKTLRYKGKFLKGVRQEFPKLKKQKEEAKKEGFQAVIADLRAKHGDKMDEIIKDIMFMAEDRNEFLKYADKFLPYYKPKLQSIESNIKEDKTIKIEVVGLDTDTKLINVSPEEEDDDK